MKQYLWLVCAAFCACATPPPAPVIERTPTVKKAEPVKAVPEKPISAGKDWRPGTYTVKKGDTLYSIGMEFGYDYKEIAQHNNLPQPYVIHVGQQLQLTDTPAAAQPTPLSPVSTAAVATPLKMDTPPEASKLDDTPVFNEPKALKTPYGKKTLSSTVSTPADTAKVANATVQTPVAEPTNTPLPAEKTTPAGDDEGVEWAWPVSGKVLSGFNEGSGNKGVDIAGTLGQPIYAAAPGKVVYSGTGLRGYGNLVIIKHNMTYLSAYAHNSKILVKEGQEIAKGQKVAEMGDTDADQVKLHFEIRKLGKPIDPMRYLPVKAR